MSVIFDAVLGRLRKADAGGSSSSGFPETASDGDIMMWSDTVDQGNNADTRLLVQPIDAAGLITDSAYGNAAPVAMTNSGVTVNENGDMVFDGSSYLDLPAGCLPSDVLDTDKEWTMDIVYRADSAFLGDYMTLFGHGNSPYFYLLFNSGGDMQIGGGPSLGGGWSVETWHHLTLELYLDGGTWKYTAFRNGAVVAAGTWTTAAWRAAELAIGYELSSPYRRFVGKMRAFKITAGATHRGQAFTPLALPWLAPLGTWQKTSLAALKAKLEALT